MTRKATKTGSAMSSKQLARTVKEGRRVTFHFSSGLVVEGYLCGMDDFHWMVVTPTGFKRLIHKGSVAVIDLADDSTYSSEPEREELEAVVGPFRGYVEETFFGRTQPASREERVSA